MTNKSSIHEKLAAIQQSLHCPKGRENTFNTHFMYRSNSDILAAVKPLLQEHGCAILQRDELVEIAGACYVKATSTLVDITTGDSESCPAYARENRERKGMDPGQLTGAASSYARKYSLNGLLAIDDVDDPDTQDNSPQTHAQKPQQNAPQPQQNAHDPFKAKAEAIIKAHADKITGDLKKWVDVCMTKGFYKDVFNNLTTLFTPQQPKGDKA